MQPHTSKVGAQQGEVVVSLSGRHFNLATKPSPLRIIATTTFPLFTALPLELRLMIWEYAIIDACASYRPHLTSMNIIADFANHLEPGYKYSYRSLLQTWTAPHSGEKIYWLNCWYRRNPLRMLLNSCCMARLIILKWMKAEARWNIHPAKVTRFNRVVGEMIADLGGRV